HRKARFLHLLAQSSPLIALIPAVLLKFLRSKWETRLRGADVYAAASHRIRRQPIHPARKERCLLRQSRTGLLSTHRRLEIVEDWQPSQRNASYREGES